VKTPEESLADLERGAVNLTWVITPVSCRAAWNGYIVLKVRQEEDGFSYHRNLDVAGGEREITRDRALGYLAGTVTDPMAD